MIRRFKFESQIYESLECVPMAVRRKLDRIGLKIGLEQWQALGRGERLAVCHLPANLEEECETMRIFVREAVKQRSGVEPRLLPESEREAAEPPVEPPARLIERGHSVGFALTPTTWNKLDPDARYALMKLGAGEAVSRNFAAALEEFLGPLGEPPAEPPADDTAKH